MTLAFSLLLVAILFLAPQAAASRTPHDPIYINGNSDFANEDNDGVINPEAIGTESDPYILENWVIDASDNNGIWIEDTTAHFVVRNCMVENGGYDYEGILLDNVVNGRIDNNTCENNDYGFYLKSSSDKNTLVNNRGQKNGRGFYLLSSSDNNTLENNLAQNNYDLGFNVYCSSNNTLVNNRAENNGDGFGLWNSSNNLLENNLAENNGDGFKLYLSSNNTLVNNLANNDWRGFYLEDSSNNTLVNNRGQKNGRGFFLEDSSNNVMEHNLVQNNNYDGFYLLSSSSNTLKNNRAQNNNDHGFYLIYSSSNTLENNRAQNNNDHGFYLDASWNNTLVKNLVENNGTGFSLDENSSNNLIYLNEILYNSDQAVDDNGSNFWDNGSVGNLWSDYAGEDTDDDNIGEDPYSIPGIGNQDNHPLMGVTISSEVGEERVTEGEGLPLLWIGVAIAVIVLIVGGVLVIRQQ